MGIVNLLKIMRNESEKVVILNLRVRPDVRDAFRIAADLRGASMSGLIHQFIVKTIREEKDREPEAFRDIVLTHNDIEANRTFATPRPRQ